MSREDLSRHNYFPNLDGLRFFAFFSVFIGHLFYFSGYTNTSRMFGYIKYRFFSFGDLGVNFFFVLSGFLITWLLVREKERSGAIRIDYFYLRRILRIWPVYFVVVGIGFFIIPDLFPGDSPFFPVHIGSKELIWYIAFIANFQIILHGMKSLVLTVLWSVSVEEQFYLFWPLLVSWLSARRFVIALLLLILLSLAYRFTVRDSALWFDYSTLSAVSALALGALSATLAVEGKQLHGRIVDMKRLHVALIYIAIFFLIPFRGYLTTLGTPFYPIYKPFEPLVFSALFALVILEQNYCGNSLFKIGKWKIISWLGRYSYGAYAYHMIALLITITIFSFLNHGAAPGFAGFVMIFISTFALTILFAYLSFEFMERKILRLKKYFTPVSLAH